MCYPSIQQTDPAEQSSESNLAHLVENLPTSAYTCAPDGRITHFNQHAVRLWGREPDMDNPEESFCGSLQMFSVKGSPIARNQCYMALALQTDTECTGKEFMIQLADGQCIDTLAYAKPVHDKSGKLIGAVGILVDISAQKHGIQSLRDEILKCRMLERKFFEYSEGEQSRLTHHLHEDLGQQLTGIALLVRVLGRRLGEEPHPELDRVIELAQLTSECIATARSLAKGSYPLELDHGGLMVALEELVYRTASLNKISCRINHDDSFQFEQEEAIHLYRIAQELIDNAVRRAGARNVVVECKARDGVAALTVTNDGIPLKYLLTQSNGVDFDLLYSRARLFGARLEIGDLEIGGMVICWLDNNHLHTEKFQDHSRLC